MKKLDSLPLPEKDSVLQVCQNEKPLTTETKIVGVRPVRHRRIAVVAIVAALLAVSGITVAATEAVQYGKAIDFFEEYDLSAEGLTRSEVKKIYRDIITESFSYEKTAQVITSGLEGYEIQSASLTSDDLSRLWLVGYSIKSEYVTNEKTAEFNLSHVMSSDENESDPFFYDEIEKSSNGKREWKKRFDSIYIEEMCVVGDQLLIAGDSSSDGSIWSGPMVSVYLINSDSTVAWQYEYDSKRSEIQVDYILRENDSFVMFAESRDDLWIAKIGMDGVMISEEHVEYDVTGSSIVRAVTVNGNYLILRESGVSQIKDGKVNNSVQYLNDGEKYAINDMIEYNGIVYLSGTVISSYDPKEPGLLKEYQKEYGANGTTEQECLEFFKEKNTAVLLVCDPQSGEALSFYTLAGAAGASLDIENGRLSWNVYRYCAARELEGNNDTYYIATGCFAELQSVVWKYVFNAYGQLVAEGNTGETVITEG